MKISPYQIFYFCNLRRLSHFYLTLWRKTKQENLTLPLHRLNSLLFVEYCQFINRLGVNRRGLKKYNFKNKGVFNCINRLRCLFWMSTETTTQCVSVPIQLRKFCFHCHNFDMVHVLQMIEVDWSLFFDHLLKF